MAVETTWLDIVTRYLLPPVLGGAGGLITIWANWGIEKRKQRLQRRRELVTGWRMNLLPMIDGAEILWAGDRKANVLASPYYASLRSHLTADAIKRIERDHLKLCISLDRTKPANAWLHHFPLNLIVEEIARIEKVWKLV